LGLEGRESNLLRAAYSFRAAPANLELLTWRVALSRASSAGSDQRVSCLLGNALLLADQVVVALAFTDKDLRGGFAKARSIGCSAAAAQEMSDRRRATIFIVTGRGGNS
jgi:hypothetical protein